MAHLKLGSDFFDISIPPSFSLIGHSSSTVFLSMLVVFFSKNTLSQYILQFCGKDLVVVWLAQTFNLKIFKCTIKWKVYIEVTNRTKKSFMSTAPLDSGSFDKKLQDPWVLLLRPSFSCGRNCRTLVQSSSVLLFFDGTFQFHNFSINSICMFFSKSSLNHDILQFCGKDLVVVWLAETFNSKIFKCTIEGKSIYWGYK